MLTDHIDSETATPRRFPAAASARKSERRESRGVASATGNGAADVSIAPTNRTAIDLNLLIVFDALIKERSLTRAGRRLGLSQPATSHALARLRQMLDDELFVRTPEGMQPTLRAEQMAEPVREALGVLSVTLEPEAFDPAAAERGFTLAVSNYAARAVVPALVRTVAELAPRVSLDVRPLGMLDVLEELDSVGADVALSTMVDGGDRFKCVRLMDDDYVVVLDQQSPAAQEESLTAARFAEAPHLVISSAGDDTAFVDAALEQLGLRRKIAARVPLLSIVLMLIGTDCVAVLPRRVAVDFSRICPLVTRDLPFPSPRIALAMIWHRRMDKHPAQRWLRETIRRVAHPA